MAARKKSARNRDNPNTVLVVFMVFFILLSIALGVTTYYGYAGQKKLEEDALNAKKAAKAAQNAEDYYKFQALTARAAIGPLVKMEGLDEPNDFAVLMEGFEDGSKFKDEKTRPAMEELVKAMKKELGWNAAQKTFASTVADKFKKQDADLKGTQASLQLAMDEKKKAEEALRGVEAKNEAYWKETRADIDRKHAEQIKEFQKHTKAMDDTFAKNQELQNELDKSKEQYDKLSRAKTRTDNESKVKMNDLEQKLAMLKKQYDELSTATAQANASLQVGDFAGKWSGTLMRGGAVTLDIKSDGTVIWSVPSIARDTETAVSHLEKVGESYMVSIQNQQVRLTLSADRRSLRLSGGGLDTTLTRKA